MALGEDDSVVEEVAGVVGVELESFWVEEQDCQDVCNGCGGSGMSTLGDSDCPACVNPQLVANVFPEREVDLFFGLPCAARTCPFLRLSLHKICTYIY